MGKTFSNTYDDLLKDMEANNITFSDYDLDLAKRNPDAGRSLYTQKVAYGQAKTDEERQKANDEAERIRQQYGGYKAGTDGTGYTLSQTYAPPASEYVSQYQDKIDQWTDKLTNQGSYSGNYGDKIDSLLEQVTNPEKYQGAYQGQIDSLNQQLQNRDPYQSAYQGDIDGLLNQIMNREDFSYNPAADPSYQAYSEKYRNEGNQAVQNVLGSAAAMNGGQLSSYALTSAQQAQNNYAAQMSDVIPQLQQLAYRMYQDDNAELRNNLSALLNQDDRAYGRYVDEGNTLRQNLASLLSQDELSYGRYLDGLNQNQNALQNLLAMDDRDYGRYMDQLGVNQSILSALMQQDNNAYNRHQDSQNDELNRWQMNYGVDRDLLADQRYENDKKTEQERYDQSLAWDTENRDYTRGWNEDDRDYDRALDRAKTLAALGDYSGFREMENSIWNRAKAMQESGMTNQQIMDYLDQFDENQLTDDALTRIILDTGLDKVRG